MGRNVAVVDVRLRRRRRSVTRTRIREAVLGALLLVLLTWVDFPYFWALISSLKPPEHLFTLNPEFLPRPATVSNYAWALSEGALQVGFINSLVVAISTTLLSTTVACFGAYSLARFRFHGKRSIIVLLLGSQMLPAMLLVIPMFLTFVTFGLFATLQGLILASASWTVPFSVLLLRSFFLTTPPDIEGQALVDGCTRFGVFWRITLPLSVPGIIAVALFVFVWTWGDIIFPLILTNDVSNQTMAIILYNLMQSTRGAVNYGGLLAAAVLFTLPTVILFGFLQKYLVQGITAGSLSNS